MKKNDKRFKQYVGTKGEDAAAGLLRDKGYNILRRNYSVHNVGEIDIIAEKDSDHAGGLRGSGGRRTVPLCLRVSGWSRVVHGAHCGNCGAGERRHCPSLE